MANVKRHEIKPGGGAEVHLNDTTEESYVLSVIGFDGKPVAICAFTCDEVDGSSYEGVVRWHDVITVWMTDNLLAQPDELKEVVYLNTGLKTPFGITFGNEYGITALYDGENIVFEMMAPTEKKDSTAD